MLPRYQRIGLAIRWLDQEKPARQNGALSSASSRDLRFESISRRMANAMLPRYQRIGRNAEVSREIRSHRKATNVSDEEFVRRPKMQNHLRLDVVAEPSHVAS